MMAINAAHRKTVNSFKTQIFLCVCDFFPIAWLSNVYFVDVIVLQCQRLGMPYGEKESSLHLTVRASLRGPTFLRSDMGRDGLKGPNSILQAKRRCVKGASPFTIPSSRTACCPSFKSQFRIHIIKCSLSVSGLKSPE